MRKYLAQRSFNEEHIQEQAKKFKSWNYGVDKHLNNNGYTVVSDEDVTDFIFVVGKGRVIVKRIVR